MCECQPTSAPARQFLPTRRELLIGAALAAPAIALAGSIGADRPSIASAAVPAVEVMPGLSIFPRDAWGADLPAKGPILRETPKFLLVHHTASSNAYTDPIAVMRSTYFFHTGPDPTKGWPDVAYEFFVGKDGGVWEGRHGALAGPVQANATGGSQGFAQLVCLLGDFTSVMPTHAAQVSLLKVLAWLADRYQISTEPGATATFVSRGSQRYPAGTVVTTPTIAPHRQMSFTACPGNTFAPAVTGLTPAVHLTRASWATVIKPAVRLGPPTP